MCDSTLQLFSCRYSIIIFVKIHSAYWKGFCSSNGDIFASSIGGAKYDMSVEKDHDWHLVSRWVVSWLREKSSLQNWYASSRTHYIPQYPTRYGLFVHTDVSIWINKLNKRPAWVVSDCVRFALYASRTRGVVYHHAKCNTILYDFRII